MFEYGNNINSLPTPIIEFVKKHNIKLVNQYNSWGGGVDFVFDFLAKGLGRDCYNASLANMKQDKRFTDEMKKELTQIISDLTDGLTSKIKDNYPQELESKQVTRP